jgi:hypothetical protein
MVSQRDLTQVVTQINSSYALLVDRLTELESELKALKVSNTSKKESKEKP